MQDTTDPLTRRQATPGSARRGSPEEDAPPSLVLDPSDELTQSDRLATGEPNVAKRQFAQLDDVRTRDVLLRITARRAEVLREIAHGYSGREIAARLGLTHSGLRSHVEALKEITGCSSTREMGRWWRTQRGLWLALMSMQAGPTEMPDNVPREVGT